jgi:hypothetical protein
VDDPKENVLKFLLHSLSYVVMPAFCVYKTYFIYIRVEMPRRGVFPRTGVVKSAPPVILDIAKQVLMFSDEDALQSVKKTDRYFHVSIVHLYLKPIFRYMAFIVMLFNIAELNMPFPGPNICFFLAYPLLLLE